MTEEERDSDILRKDAPCLHCLIEGVVDAYWQQFGIVNPDSNMVAMDVPLTVAKMVEATVDIVLRVEEGAVREKLIADIHRLIDGIIYAKRNGTRLEIEVGGLPVIN